MIQPPREVRHVRVRVALAERAHPPQHAAQVVKCDQFDQAAELNDIDAALHRTSPPHHSPPL